MDRCLAVEAKDDYYSWTFAAETKAGRSAVDAAAQVAHAYLDGRPRRAGKRRTTRVERALAFSASPFLRKLPPRAWSEHSLTLALGSLVGQEVDTSGLLEHVARVAPSAARRAVCVSGLALRPDATHRRVVERLETLEPDEFGDFAFVFGVIAAQCRRCRQRVDELRRPLAQLSPLALLVYASLYAFKHIVPRAHAPTEDEDTERFWLAASDVFAWKLETAPASAFRLTERDIGKCLAEHLSPWLLPAPGHRRRTDLLAAFEELMDAEAELQEAQRTAETFCYDDAAAFVRRGDRVEFVVLDAAAQVTWRKIGERLRRLRTYWYMRGLEAFADSPLATEVIGRPENHEWNRVAYIKAMATELRLKEVYGVGDTVSTATGLEAPIFKGLLSRELVAAFSEREFIQPFGEHLARTGSWADALGALAFGGFVEGMQNRMPFTFSRREEKVRNTVGWTVDADRPRGSRRQARAIVDLWTNDWSRFAENLGRGEPGLVPELFERPFLKLGQYLFELPWVNAFQSSQAAAINNLRRLGARRPEARLETQRIEEGLAGLLRERGFRVRLNWVPEGNAGEVDIVCARDGRLLVLEVKSTYVRRSLGQAWHHGATGLRRAGVQLQGKVPVVTGDAGLVSELSPGLESPPLVHAWIVDTSLEHDHERFEGFLKVSLEELIIALRDDRGLLRQGEEVFGAGGETQGCVGPGFTGEADCETLYPRGFSFASFVEVIESESVWELTPR